MADFSNLTYSSLQTAITDWLARSDLTGNTPDFISLFEVEANRTLRTRQMENTTLLYPQTAYSFTITNCANNGSNAIRVTFTATSTSTVVIQAALGTGNEVAVQNVNGTIEANNNWISTLVSSATLDLQNSTFINTYTSGGTMYNSNAGETALPVRLPSLSKSDLDRDAEPRSRVHAAVLAAHSASDYVERQYQPDGLAFRVHHRGRQYHCSSGQ